MGKGFRDLLSVLGLTVVVGLSVCAPAFAGATASGVFVAGNCAPVAAASDGTMVWYSRNAAGVWDAYIGNGACQGAPLLPAYDGNRGPAGITADGRYVLLTSAVGWDKALPDSSPGQGSGNAIELYDRQTGKLSTLLAGASASQRGVIWPTFNASGTKIVWSQMLKTATEAPPNGQWALHVADVDLATGTLSDNVEWQDPDGQPAFYEAYGWIPNTNRLIFMSTTRASAGDFRGAQLFTLPDELNPATAPTRISPMFAPVWPWQSAVNVFHEFAHFAPNEPNTLYTSIGADTVGGDDLFSYNMQSEEAGGLLGQPTRISYFGGDLNANWGTKAIPGWPAPSYTVVTTMAWVDGGWVITTCPDLLCSTVNAWRVEQGTSSEAQEPPASTTGSTQTPGSGASKRSPWHAAGRVALVLPKLNMSRGHATVKLRCSDRGPCTGRLTLSVKHASGRGRARRVKLETIGTADFMILPGTSTNVKVRVSGAGAALLAAGHGRLHAMLTIASPVSQTAGGVSAKVDQLSHTAVRISGWSAPAVTLH